MSNSTAIPPTSDQPSSTPVPLSSDTPTPTPAPSSTPPASSSPPPPSSAPPVSTSVFTASSVPPSTKVITSLVTPTPTAPGETPTPQTIVVTITNSQPNAPLPTDGAASSTATITGTPGATLQDPKSAKAQGGLGTGAKTAIAVVVPVVVVAALVLAGIILWRRRKQKKNAEEARRKEVEEYGYNPNNDPTLPAVGMASEMSEDQSGYRGWGNTTTTAGSNRKASTTLTSGMTYSDSNSNPGGYQSPGSPTQGTYSDGHSGDPLVNGKRETLDSDGIGALGAGPNANQNQAGVHRGPSNASSSYSAADRSDNSGDYPIPMNNPQDYYDNNGYYQAGPYDNNGYGGGQQPIIRDVSARRNTRIENPSVFPQQGNSGIAQNF